MFDGVVAKHLDSLQLTEAQRDQVRGSLAREYQLLAKRMPAGLDAGGLAVRLTKRLGKELTGMATSDEVRKRVLGEVQQEAREALLLKATSPCRVLVGVKSAEVRDAHPEAVMRISMKLTEEAMEWTVLDQDREKAILSPE